MAEWISVHGTGSDVGKTVITAALCKLLSEKGHKVAPFKPVNYSLNAYPVDNSEIGYGTKFQAQKAGCKLSKELNPLLVKPMRNRSEIVGKETKQVKNKEIDSEIGNHYEEVKKAAEKLDRKYDYIIHEGFGSFISSNLENNLNIRFSREYSSRIFVVGDVSRGGIESSLTGCYNLLPEELEIKIEKLIINRLHDSAHNTEELKQFIEENTGKEISIIKEISDLKTPPEDGAPEFEGSGEIAVVNYPNASNLTDLWKLPSEKTKLISEPEGLDKADLVILPGSKNTIEDLKWLKKKDFNKKLDPDKHVILGICGGLQILGSTVKGDDSETDETEQGLGLVDAETEYRKSKKRESTDVEFDGTSFTGYQIRYGETKYNEIKPLFQTGEGPEGFELDNVLGTYIHDCLNNQEFRRKVMEKASLEYKDIESEFEELKEEVSKQLLNDTEFLQD